jgi:hypothetical protein
MAQLKISIIIIVLINAQLIELLFKKHKNIV